MFDHVVYVESLHVMVKNSFVLKSNLCSPLLGGVVKNTLYGTMISEISFMNLITAEQFLSYKNSQVLCKQWEECQFVLNKTYRK